MVDKGIKLVAKCLCHNDVNLFQINFNCLHLGYHMRRKSNWLLRQSLHKLMLSNDVIWSQSLPLTFFIRWMSRQNLNLARVNNRNLLKHSPSLDYYFTLGVNLGLESINQAR